MQQGSGTPGASLKTIFEACRPRDEVLRGELRDELFAARLKDVVDGTADPVYGDAEAFFRNTFPTDGLKRLAREVVGRLSGERPDGAPFLRLETSFGGGKTHDLIALYHMARGAAAKLPAALVETLIDPRWLPCEPWPVAAVVGSDLDPAGGLRHDDGVVTRTLWGEVAHMLGGSEGYETVRASDESGAAPGTQWLERLVGDGPALVMIDEIPRYLVAAKAVETANRKSNLAEQTVAFLLSLIEYATCCPKVCVVITLADPNDAFGEQTEELHRYLADARSVSARSELVVTPAGETEIARIVTHRLFANVDEAVAKEVAAAYVAHFTALVDQGVTLPERVTRSEYAAEIERCYPFHPELLNTLHRKTATIPNFQRTRGALRLLARVVRRLWEQRPAGTHLVCVHHLDLAVEEVLTDLTSRLDRPAMRNVAEADIVSAQEASKAHCQLIDRQFVDAGKPPYATRLGTSVFLHSLSQIGAPGVEPADLLAAVLQPGDDPGLAHRALGLMLGEEHGEPGTACWYLHWDGHRYVFKTEPSLEKVIQDEIGMVGIVRAKAELDERIRRVWEAGVFQPVWFPREAADVPDDAHRPKLVVLHYDAAPVSGDEEQPPELARKLFDFAGSAEGYRIYKNNVLFLAAAADQVPRMVAMAQRLLALTRILDDSERLRNFTDQQRRRLQQMRDAAQLEVRVAITRAYRHLYNPSEQGVDGLAHLLLPAQEQGAIEQDQSESVLRALREANKVLTADDPVMAPVFVRDRAWPHGQKELSTLALLREFAKRIGLKMLLDPNQVKQTVRTGIGNGVWVYYDAANEEAYGKESPPPVVQVSDDAILFEPDEARRRGLRFKGEGPEPGDGGTVTDETCPLCGKSPCQCQPEAGHELEAEASGPTGQALRAVLDKLHDAGASHVQQLLLRVSGSDDEGRRAATALGLALPQIGKARLFLRHALTAEFPGERSEYLRLEFEAGWDRYRVLKQALDSLAGEASKLTVTLEATVDFDDPLPLDDPRTDRLYEVLTRLPIGSLTVKATGGRKEGE